MTLNNLTQTHPRRRRTALGIVFASLVLGSTLTACGSDAGDTTCGEFKDMSADERLDLINDDIEDNGTDEEKEQWDAFPDEQKAAAAELAVAACDGEGDDTKLDDIDL